MQRSCLGLLAALALSSVALAQPSPSTSQPPPPAPALALEAAALPADVVEVVQARVADGRHPGMIIAVVDESGAHYYPFGVTSLAGHTPPDEHTLYEIGSITKVFTAILLADMVEKRELALETPMDGLLPRGVAAPNFLGQPITLAQLATHTSGLPRMPDNIKPKEPRQPYADYTPQRLYDFLSHYSLDSVPGRDHLYSNLGFGLLGQLLCLRTGQSYEQLVAGRITSVLGMRETFVTLSHSARARLAQPTSNGFAAVNWDLGVLAGAGALRSSAHDLALFLAANLHPSGPLGAALTLAQEPRVTVNARGDRIGLAWAVNASGNDEILGHDGGTGGYSSFIGFLRRGGRGVAILSNSTTAVADIGLHLLDPAAPLSAGYNPANNPSLTLRARVHANGERITRGENPVLNGDFSDGDVHWGVDPINWPGPVEHRVQAGALCATLHAGENVRLEWPDSAAAEAGVTGFALARDRQYRLSFRARASGQVRVAASVGHVTPPYTRAVEVVVPLRSSERLFSVDFQSLEADESAGVALRISASSLAQRSELCIDDVALSTLD